MTRGNASFLKMIWSRAFDRSPLYQEDDFAGDPVGDDLVVLNHAFGFLDPERHDPAQGLGSLCDRGAARIVEAGLGLHGDIDVAHDWHVRLRWEVRRLQLSAIDDDLERLSLVAGPRRTMANCDTIRKLSAAGPRFRSARGRRCPSTSPATSILAMPLPAASTVAPLPRLPRWISK